MVLKLISEVEPRAKSRTSAVAAVIKDNGCLFLFVQRYLCIGALLHLLI